MEKDPFVKKQIKSQKKIKQRQKIQKLKRTIQYLENKVSFLEKHLPENLHCAELFLDTKTGQIEGLDKLSESLRKQVVEAIETGEIKTNESGVFQLEN